MLHQGRCHCGAVRFEVEAGERVTVIDCNCSICAMTGFRHMIVPQSRFRLLAGKDALATYTFNTGTAKHLFCKTCGVKPYYVPRSNPDGIDVNLRCLDPQPAEIVVEAFDGRNWDAAGSLAHLSSDRPQG